MDFPETPEAVAFALFCLVLEKDPAMKNPLPAEQLIALFRRCLAVARGEEDGWLASVQ